MLTRFITLCSLLVITQLQAQIIISEFLADNVSGIKDENDSRQDWIELYNSSSSTVSVSGWWLTDKTTNTALWQFPNVSIPANGTLLVWASGKDRRIAGQPLHTNFSLAKSGEYLGLYKPHATTGQPELVNDFSPSYPAQATDVSYGRTFGSTTTTILPSGASGKYKFPTSTTIYSGTNYASGEMGHGAVTGWNRSSSFDDSGWANFTSGLGYDANGLFSSLVSTNIQSTMRNFNNSVCVRMKFTVSNPAAYDSYKIRIKYEDGCTMFLNGGENAIANYANPTNLAFNSLATNAPLSTWQQWSEVSVPASSIVSGENLLAIQGCNSSTNSSDFLILPEVIGINNLSLGSPGYFTISTPNAPNGSSASGPILYSALPEDPLIPRPTGTAASQPLTISVRVVQTANPISVVRVIPRIMYNAELSAITMLDNGVAPDLVSGDKIYTANIATNSLTYGQMLRWRFEVVDSASNLTKLPAYLDPIDSPQYFGTVAQRNDLANSLLPVVDWFVEGAPATGPTAAAFRGSMFFLGYFYDNIGHEIHGQSTAGLTKKSYDFDSNTGYRFLWQDGQNRVKDLNMLSNYADKTKARNTVSQEVIGLMGAPNHFCKPVRMHLNGAFHGVVDMLEDGDDRLLERNGLDPEGAFYKIYAETMNSVPEKKTRKTEANTDLNTLTTSLDPAIALTTRRTYAYDNVNIAATVNYLVTRQLNSDADHGHKNYYLYRDTNITGEWMPIVWDVDLTQGHQWNGNNNTGGYFNDSLITDNPLNRHSTANRLYNLMLESPEFQEMFARRMRTAMDQFLGAPGSPQGLIANRMAAIVALVDPDPANPSPLTDGDVDHAKWGMPSTNFINNRPREEVTRVLNEYFPARRTFLYNQTSSTRPLVQKPLLTGGTPIPNLAQSANPGAVLIQAIDFYPSSESQNSEYIILKNTSAQAIDLTGWKLTGAINHNFTAGTVIPSGAGTAAAEYKGLLHIVKNTAAFRARTTGPKGGEKRFIQGNYSGQLSSRGETITLVDSANTTIASFTYTGAPTLAQQYLRISEIHYNPTAPSSTESMALPGINNDDFEFIEITNTGNTSIDLTGYSITAGFDFTFPSTSIAAGARIVIAKNPAAFLLRHPGFTGVLGGYDDNLSNGGERIELTEASGEVVTDFSYDDLWYPYTDGGGSSLVLRNVNTADSLIGLGASWVMSPETDGSPGTGDVFATITLTELTKTYTGSALNPTIVTTPPGLPVSITFDGISTEATQSGSYAVVATITAPNYEGTTTGTFTIQKAAATLAWSNLTHTYDGTAKSATLSSTPAGLTTTITYDGNSSTPTNAGTYSLQANINDPNYEGSSTGTFAISKALANVTLGSLAATYDGTSKAASATTPEGLSVNLTYDGSTTVPTAAGTYQVVATIVDDNYEGTASGNLIIGKGVATVTLGNLAVTYDGTAKAASATTTPEGLTVSLTYDGNASAPTNAGSYEVVATISDANYEGTATGTLLISKALANVTLGNLAATYDGTSKAAFATTTPEGLTVNLTYNDNASAPTNAGTYALQAIVNEPNYVGTASETFTIEKASQTLIFPTIGDIPIDGGPVVLSATSDRNLPVSFSIIQGSGSIDAAILTPLASGQVRVVATQNGDDNHLAAHPVERSFIVTHSFADSQWRNNHFTLEQRTNAAISGDQADPDRDGFCNLIEYAMLTNPWTSDRTNPQVVAGKTIVLGQTYQTLQFRRRIHAAEIITRAEVATSLDQWTHQATELIEVNPPVANGDGTETVTYRSIHPYASRGKEFLRLHVEISP